jgi:hypothetical protein
MAHPWVWLCRRHPDDQAVRLDHIYAHWQPLTHEPVKCLVDPDLDPDVELYVDAMLKALRHRECASGRGPFFTRVSVAPMTLDRYGHLLDD